MKKYCLYMFTATVLMFSCKQKTNGTRVAGSDSASETVKTDSAITRLSPDSATAGDADSTYAYIKNITQKADTVFIRADYIQFLTGKAAVEAAKKNHEADTMRDDKGKITDIIVDNDYYILNENKKLRELVVAKRADIETIDMASGNMDTKKTSLQDMISKHGHDNLPFVLKFKNNEVTEIHEVYLP